MPPRKAVEDNLSREVFEVHMKYVNNSLNGLNDLSIKLIERLEKQEKILYRNTLTVEEHQKRSTSMEGRQEEFMKMSLETTKALEAVQHAMQSFQVELTPIKETIEKNAKFFDRIDWLNANKGMIFKGIIVTGATAIVLYILLKDVEAIQNIFKAVF